MRRAGAQRADARHVERGIDGDQSILGNHYIVDVSRGRSCNSKREEEKRTGAVRDLDLFSEIKFRRRPRRPTDAGLDERDALTKPLLEVAEHVVLSRGRDAVCLVADEKNFLALLEQLKGTHERVGAAGEETHRLEAFREPRLMVSERGHAIRPDPFELKSIAGEKVKRVCQLIGRAAPDGRSSDGDERFELPRPAIARNIAGSQFVSDVDHRREVDHVAHEWSHLKRERASVQLEIEGDVPRGRAEIHLSHCRAL